MATPRPIRAVITPLGNLGLAAIQLHSWSGWIPGLQDIPDRFRRTGAAGSGSQSLGQEGTRVTCTGIRDEISFAAAAISIAAIEKLQDQVVRILDDWGRTIPRCKIWRAQAAPVRTKGPVVTGTATTTHRVAVSLDVERLPDP